MTPTPDAAIANIRIQIGNLPDHDYVTVSVGALRALIAEAQDHAHCEEGLDDLRDEMTKEHDEEAEQLAADAREQVSEVEDAIETVRKAMRKLKDLLG